MRITNANVWIDGKFVKKDLCIEKGIFIDCNKYLDEKVLNLEGKYILPGFSDSHAHVLGIGIKLLTLNLENTDVVDAVLKSNDKFILGRGWSNLPQNIEILNEVDKPVILIRRCGHIAWINKLAQEMLGMNKFLLEEDELEKIWELLPEDFYIEAFEKAQNEMLKKGITSVHSDDFHGITFETLTKLLKRSKIRIYEKLYTTKPWKYAFKDFGKSKIFGVKLFADGSLGGKTAFLSTPYSDTKDNFGRFVLPQNFKDIVEFADKNNLQVCVHTIGDEALTRVLDLFGKHYGHRIIHAQLVKKADFLRLKNFVFSIQPHFYFEDREIIKYVSKKNLYLYPFKKMYDTGIGISFSSDAPVSPFDPWYVINSALKLGFSFAESIKLYTESSGEIINEKIGKIKEGYKADFVVFNDKELTDINSVYVDGKKLV